MEITALGYIGIGSSQLDQWSQMATHLLGMQQVDRGGKARAFRMDDRKQRVIVDGSSDSGLAVMGWEVPTSAELDRLGRHTNDHMTSFYVNRPASSSNMAGADASLIRKPGSRMKPLTGPRCEDMSGSKCPRSKAGDYAT
jgi:hypothetical protein